MPTWSKSDALPAAVPSPRLSRRSLLAGGSRAATLVAARSLAPALFAGCSAGLPQGSEPIVVGLLHSQTGTLAISETALRDAELFAIEEINAAGGLLGRQIEPKSPDPRSRPLDLFPKRARELCDRAGAAAIFGCWTSSSRKAVIPVLEEFGRLLFYPVQYEGNEASRNVVYGGSIPNQQILPAIDWLLSPEGGSRQRIFLLGSDYVFPRTANLIVKRYLASRGLEPAGMAYVPLGHRQFTGAVEMIQAAKADAVLSTINGDSNVAFFAALAEAGVTAENVPVVSTSIGEDELRNLPPEQVQGQLAAWSYFQSVPTEANRAWVSRFRHEFGYDRVTSDPMEAAYCMVHLWRQAVERAGALDTPAVRDALQDDLRFQGPGGEARIDPATQHACKRFRLGRIRPDRQFDIVQESADPIAPDPFPQVAFPGWHCDWTADGLTQGAEVVIDGDL
ncbi:MAG: Aliphatic amidase expression-regulating protein [Planctomycetota bacterium]